ncbi:MAG: helix-turn-helix transcriptional regulator [Clostridia bacterium]|nr:helix-turn-helix transcriptional regulator [Clostridia bacterium]
MEKKTIGKFISALRKANGMTQRELGERLFVSDKTVSRWECDECTPELSLIPSIAEIFGVSTDELLRGERSERDGGESEYKKGKSDKQFKLMLHEAKKRFSNITLLSVSLSVIGLISVLVCRLVFSKALLGLCLAALFFVGGAIVQIGILSSARLLEDEDDEHVCEIKKFNTGVVLASVKIFFLILLLIAVCISAAILYPADYNRPFFFVFLDSTLIFVVMLTVPTYILWRLWILRRLVKGGAVYMDDSERTVFDKNTHSLRRITLTLALIVLAIFLSVFFLGLATATFDPETYNFFRPILSSLYWISLVCCTGWYLIEKRKNSKKS